MVNEGPAEAGGRPNELVLERADGIDFSEGLARMRATAEARARGEGEDTLFVFEHPEVLSVGRRQGARDNILIFEIPVVAVDRGGDVTWHGPGQLVCYPVVRLEGRERDVLAVLRRLEQAVVEVLREVGLEAGVNPPHTGVWARGRDGQQKKVCSMGIGVSRWVVTHGLSLNVDTDLARFALIRPCGLEAGVMGSVASLGGRVDRDKLVTSLHHKVAAVFGRVPSRR